MSKKIFAIIIGVEILICILGLIGFVFLMGLAFNSNNSHVPSTPNLSTPIVSYRIETPSLTSTPIPTETPAQIYISTPTTNQVSLYMKEVSIRATRYEKALINVSNDSTEVGSNPSLIVDQSWKTNIKNDLDELLEAGDELGSIPNVPQSYSDIDTWLKKIKSETRLFYDDIIIGIDTMSPAYIEKAISHMQNINMYVNNATNLMQTLVD